MRKQVREIVTVKGEEEQRVIWKIGRINELLVEKDRIIGSVRIKTA